VTALHNGHVGIASPDEYKFLLDVLKPASLQMKVISVPAVKSAYLFWEQDLNAKKKAEPEKNTEKSHKITYAELDGFGIVTIPDFLTSTIDSQFSDLQNYFSRANKLGKIIIDIRRNGGGSQVVADKVINLFARDYSEDYYYAFRGGSVSLPYIEHALDNDRSYGYRVIPVEGTARRQLGKVDEFKQIYHITRTTVYETPPLFTGRVFILPTREPVSVALRDAPGSALHTSQPRQRSPPGRGTGPVSR